MGGLTGGYVLRRFGMFLLTVWLGSTLIFVIPRLAPVIRLTRSWGA